MLRALPRVGLAGLCLASAASSQGLPPVPVPPENPTSPAKAVLGKILFWEEQLSSDNTVACGTCHINQAGGSDPRSLAPPSLHPGPDGLLGTPDDVRGSMGVVRCSLGGSLLDDGSFFPQRQVTGRRSMPFFGPQWSPSIFWDGRAEGAFLDPDTGQVLIPAGGALEIQALEPMVSAVEMSCETRPLAAVAAKIASSVPMRLASDLPPDVAAALAASPTYPDLFAAAFGTPEVTAARMAMAIATYERSLVPDQTPWDSFVAGNPGALTPAQVAGLNAFNAPAPVGGNCSICHAPPLFTDHSFRALGRTDPVVDPGRQGVTGLFADRGRFKVPSLRNVGLRAPFFHDGGVPSLNLVMGFYNGGGPFPDNQDPLVPPINLPPIVRNQIVDFLQNGLTDPRAAQGLPPFDRPTLHSELLPPNPRLYGFPSAGSGGIPPFLIAFAPPNLGNPSFVIGVGRGLGGAVALFAFADESAPPGFNLSGIPIQVDLLPPPVVVPVVLGGPVGAAGEGHASLVSPIPGDPALVGARLFSQALVADPVAIGGLASSRGAEMTLFGP